MTSILFFSGSSQRNSVNSKLVAEAAYLTEKTFGKSANVRLIELREFDLPTFDAEISTAAKLPKNVARFSQMLENFSKFFIGADEYTGSYSALFRNTLSWVNFASKKEKILSGKQICLCSATPQGVGGLRGHPALTQLLVNLGATVISQHISLGSHANAFEGDGALIPSIKEQIMTQAIPNLIKIETTKIANQCSM